MIEIVMVNAAALVLLAALPRREGSSYLEARRRVKEALREANRRERASTPVPGSGESPSRGFRGGGALRPAMVGVYALAMVGLTTGIAVQTDGDGIAAAGVDPVLQMLEPGDRTSTFSIELHEFGRLCADGAVDHRTPRSAKIGSPAPRVPSARHARVVREG